MHVGSFSENACDGRGFDEGGVGHYFESDGDMYTVGVPDNSAIGVRLPSLLPCPDQLLPCSANFDLALTNLCLALTSLLLTFTQTLTQRVMAFTFAHCLPRAFQGSGIVLYNDCSGDADAQDCALHFLFDGDIWNARSHVFTMDDTKQPCSGSQPVPEGAECVFNAARGPTQNFRRISKQTAGAAVGTSEHTTRNLLLLVAFRDHLTSNLPSR